MGAGQAMHCPFLSNFEGTQEVQLFIVPPEQVKQDWSQAKHPELRRYAELLQDKQLLEKKPLQVKQVESHTKSKHWLTLSIFGA